jgi:hypothetical protein
MAMMPFLATSVWSKFHIETCITRQAAEFNQDTAAAFRWTQPDLVSFVQLGAACQLAALGSSATTPFS